MENKSSIEEVDEVTRKIKVTIPAESVVNEVATEIGNLKGRVSVKGFRQGKAPKEVIERLHGDRVRMEVAHRLISSSLREVLRDKALDVVGEPEIDISSFEKGAEIEYEASVSLMPKPQISNYDSFKIELVEREITDKEVSEVINRILDSKATPRKLESREVAEKGDIIEGDLQVEVEGEEAAPAEPLVIELGKGELPPELDEGLVGLKIGETREIKGKIPTNHPEQKLRGKEALYRLTLKGLSEKILPELDDDFVKGLPIEAETALELKVKIREQLEEQLQSDIKSEAHAKILDQLIESNEFKVPQVLIDEEIKALLVRGGMVDPNKVDLSRISVEAFRENLGDVALKRVRTALLVDRLAEQEELRASEDDLTKALEQVSEQNGISIEEVRKFFADEGRSASFAIEQTRNKVLDFLYDRSKVDFVKAPDEEQKEEETDR